MTSTTTQAQARLHTLILSCQIAFTISTSRSTFTSPSPHIHIHTPHQRPHTARVYPTLRPRPEMIQRRRQASVAAPSTSTSTSGAGTGTHVDLNDDPHASLSLTPNRPSAGQYRPSPPPSSRRSPLPYAAPVPRSPSLGSPRRYHPNELPAHSNPSSPYPSGYPSAAAAYSHPASPYPSHPASPYGGGGLHLNIGGNGFAPDDLTGAGATFGTAAASAKGAVVAGVKDVTRLQRSWGLVWG